jgi:hypothetical protein
MGARHNWLAVRTAYVVKGLTAQQCADEFGINVTTIKIKASREGWTEERNRIATQGAEVVADEMRAAVQSAMASHSSRATRALELSDKLADKIELAIDSVGDDTRALRSITETYHRFSEALAKGFASDRLVRAIRDGVASDGDDSNAKTKTRRFILVTPEESEAEKTQSA